MSCRTFDVMTRQSHLSSSVFGFHFIVWNVNINMRRWKILNFAFWWSSQYLPELGYRIACRASDGAEQPSRLIIVNCEVFGYLQGECIPSCGKYICWVIQDTWGGRKFCIPPTLYIVCLESGNLCISRSRCRILLILTILKIEHKNLVEVLAGCTSAFLSDLLASFSDDFREAVEYIVVAFGLWTMIRELL